MIIRNLIIPVGTQNISIPLKQCNLEYLHSECMFENWSAYGMISQNFDIVLSTAQSNNMVASSSYNNDNLNNISI